MLYHKPEARQMTSSNPKQLRVLMIESSAEDAARILTKLDSGGFSIDHVRVDQAETLRIALADFAWDAILCSHNPLGFDGLSALKIVQQAGIDLPCIFLSYDLSEQIILDALRLGADDYIFSASLTLLIPSLERNLRAAHVRREHRLAQLALRDSQTQLHSFIANVPGMVYRMLRKTDGSFSFPFVSEGSLHVLGVSPESLQQSPHLFLGLLHPEEHVSYHESMHYSIRTLAFWTWQGRIISLQDGTIKWIELRCSPRKMEHGEIWWEGIMFNITQSKLAEIAMQHSQAQVRELSAHILEVREQERLNIAREVHDQLGNMLTAIKLDVAWLKKRLPADNAQITEKSKDIENLLDKCIVTTNNISRTLRPSVLDAFGVIAAVEVEVKEFEQRTGIPCVFNFMDVGEKISPDISITLFRILQEALSNSMKYAQASQIKVTINSTRHSIDLVIEDNGQGFSEDDMRKPRSFGLRGIKERVAHIGGEVRIKTSRGQGVTIMIYVPRHIPEMDAYKQQTLWADMQVNKILPPAIYKEIP